MTDEEIQILQDQLIQANKDLEEKEIEIRSLKNENDQFRKDLQNNKEELQKTKEMNYTLTRSLDISGKKKVNTEKLIAEMFN